MGKAAVQQPVEPIGTPVPTARQEGFRCSSRCRRRILTAHRPAASAFATSSALGARRLRGERKHAAHRLSRGATPRAGATGGSSAERERRRPRPERRAAAAWRRSGRAQPDSLSGGQAESVPLPGARLGRHGSAHVYIGPANTATTLLVGLYSNAGDHPGSLLAPDRLSSPLPGAWNTVPLTSTQLASGTTYWLAVLGTGGTLRYRDRAHGPCPAPPAPRTTSRRRRHLAHRRFYRDCPVSAYVTAATTFPVEPPAPVELASPRAPAPPSKSPPPSKPHRRPSKPPRRRSKPRRRPSKRHPHPSKPHRLPSKRLRPRRRPRPTARLPTIAGTAEENQSLTATTGTWTGNPTSYSYQWEDCNTTGEACADIGAATSSTYKPTAADVGHTLRVVVPPPTQAAPPGHLSRHRPSPPTRHHHPRPPPTARHPPSPAPPKKTSS